MISFSGDLSAFSRGELSAEDLLLKIEQTIASSDERIDTVLATLENDTRISPLPPRLRTAIEERIVTTFSKLARTSGGTASPRPTPLADDATRLTGKGDTDDDATRMLSASPADIDLGDTIARRFVLEELLGTGGMGKVFKALDRRRLEAQDRQPYVAVKVLSRSFRQHPSAFMALQREAKKALSLAHPNIVRVYDFDRDERAIFMTMEYLSGQSLDRLIKAPGFSGMPLPKAMEIIAPIGSALAFAHKNGIVHCDFKPSNVFLTEEGQVKVIDFGIARAIKHGGPEADLTRFDVSALGALTPAYASPEMIEGLDPEARDDIYSLACVVYELLTGRHPFDRTPATVARARGLVPKPPAGLRRRQWAALRSALGLVRDKRPPSVETFLRSLSPAVVPWPRIAILAASALAVVTVTFFSYEYIREAINRSLRPPDLATIVASVPCSLLTATADDRSISVVGYAPSRDAIDGMEQELRKLNPTKSISTNLLQSVDPQHCATIDFFKPFFLANLGQQPPLRLHLPQTGAALREGEALPGSIATSARPTYVSLDYFAVDGTVFHVLQGANGQGNLQPAQSTLSLASRQGQGWVVRPPYGTQLLVAFSALEPIFAERRPNSEPARVYLDALRTVLQRRPPAEAGSVLADFDFLRIEPRF